MVLGLSAIRADQSRSAVLSAIAARSPLDRRGIVDATGLSWATVSRLVADLISEDIVAADPPTSDSELDDGRLRLNERMAVVAGVDLGGTNCRFVVSDCCGRSLGRHAERTPTDLTGPALADWLAGKVYALVSDSTGGARLGAVALGLPGAVSADGEGVTGSLNLPAIEGITFTQTLRDAFGAPTVFANDSNLALLGELRYGSVLPTNTTVLLVLGTGLSAAVALNGEIILGEQGALGEFGRLPLPGSKDRMRDFVSGAGLLAYAHRHGHAAASAAELLRGPGADDELLDRVHQALEGIINLVALAYEPQTVLITGGFSDSLDDQLLADLGPKVAESVGVRLSVRRATLGDDAGLLGALSLALCRFAWTLGIDQGAPTTTTSKAAILSAFRSCFAGCTAGVDQFITTG